MINPYEHTVLSKKKSDNNKDKTCEEKYKKEKA